MNAMNKSSGGAPIQRAGSLSIASPSIDPETLFLRNSKYVLRVCRHYALCREDAEDIVQEIFLKVDSYTHEHPGETKPISWIYRMTVNKCLDYLRSRKSKKEIHLPGRDFEALPVDLHYDDELLAKVVLERILHEVNPMTQQCLLLSVEDLNHKEIAAILGVTREAVTKQLSRFHKRMSLVKDW